MILLEDLTKTTKPVFTFMNMLVVFMISTITIIVILAVSNSCIAISSLSAFNNENTNQGQLSVKIIDPVPQSTITSNAILVNGTANSFGSANSIKKVEVIAHTYPFPSVFNFTETNPISKGNWSKWSIRIPINSTGAYRILARVTDNLGNENWAETQLNVPFFSYSPEHTDAKVSVLPQLRRIAIIIPTFTETAYSTRSFHTFYSKYNNVPIQQEVKTDLDMLNPSIVTRDVYIKPSEKLSTTNLSSYSIANPDDRYILSLAAHLQRNIPNSSIAIIRDEDIHNGYIFTNNNSSVNKSANAYDMLILAHDEYATQTMYDNYKRFVSNGGTLLALDANIFVGEIKYNKENNTITFVKGHSWDFDGNSAKRSIWERWFNENSQWLGSNFLQSELKDNITFMNNPFNYTHFQENFVNNPKDKILIDYGAVIPRDNPFFGSTVASYELDFGKGKVVMVGLYGQNLVDNHAFQRFLDILILHYL